MSSVMSAIQNTVSISQFNRGLAGKIFEDVKHCGAKVVMKNNAAECVLLSPAEYVSLMDEINDARLLALANERMAHLDTDTLVSQADVDTAFGFTGAELADADEVELE